MRALGVLLVFLGAGGWCLLRRQEGRAVLRLARALEKDLAVLGYQIRVCRRPLPAVLGEQLSRGPGREAMWLPLLERLEADGGGSLEGCWTAAAETLPEGLGRIMAPLGAMLPAGGRELEEAVEETREELAGFLREEAARQADQGRVQAALCLSGACLAVLVLL